MNYKDRTILLLAIISIAMGIYACWPEPTRLLSVYEIQTELVNRGHDIKVDGKFGKNTRHALDVEITKQEQ